MRDDLKAELEELAEYISEQNEAVTAMTRSLDPYFARRRHLRNLARKTHDWISGEEAVERGWRHACEDQDYVTAWRPGERAGVFAELDRLALVHGPACTARKIAAADLAAAIRAANRIRDLLAKPMRRKREVTGDLFAERK